MEEAALLVSVQRDVGRVQIKHDLPRRPLMRLQEQIDEKAIDVLAVAVNLMVLRTVSFRRVLQTIECALASNRRAVRPQHRFELAGQHRKHRVLAQLVMIVEVLVAECQSENALSDQRLDTVLDVARVAPIGETLRKTPYQRLSLSLSECRDVTFKSSGPGSSPSGLTTQNQQLSAVRRGGKIDCENAAGRR